MIKMHKELWKTIVNLPLNLDNHSTERTLKLMEGIWPWEVPHLRWLFLPNQAYSPLHLLSAKKTLPPHWERLVRKWSLITTLESQIELSNVWASLNFKKEMVVPQTLKSGIIFHQRKKNSKYTLPIRGKSATSVTQGCKLKRQSGP